MSRNRPDLSGNGVSDRISVLQRMVALSVVVLVVFFGFALVHQTMAPVPDAAEHLDKSRAKHFQALLSAIRPAASNSVHFTEHWPKDCADIEQNLGDDIDELDRRLLAMTQGTSPFLTRIYRLDAVMWLEQAKVLPGSCSQAAKSLSYLLWTDPKNRYKRDLLFSLYWKDRRKKQQWQWGDGAFVALSGSSFATPNPWANLPGCVLLSEHQGQQGEVRYAVTGGRMGRECGLVAGKDARGDPATLALGATSVPRNLALLANDINAWRMPDSRVYQALVGDSNKLTLPGGKRKSIGLHAQFTFDPQLQRTAQSLVECHAGNQSACKEAGINNPGEGMIDDARVRQVGLAVIDIPTGEVLVAASAENACFRHDLSGTGSRPANCPDFGQAARDYLRRDDSGLLNHALFTVAPPGSTVKPILMAGFLADPGFRKSNEDITNAMRTSNSRLFLDWLFCRGGDGHGAFSFNCQRPALVQSAAHSLGWNAGCESGHQCGAFDVLLGRPVQVMPQGFPGNDTSSPRQARFDPSERTIQIGRLLVTGDNEQIRDLASGELLPNSALLGNCAAGAYSACQGRGMSSVSEGFGQGNARATPVGVAAMMAQLASLSGSGKPMRHPHVIKALLTIEGQPDPAGDPARWGIPLTPKGIDQARASQIIQALGQAHRANGTASGGCNAILGESACNQLELASKTGTTTFGSELASLKGYQNRWNQYGEARNKYLHCIESGAKKCASPPSSPHRPWRWYTGVFKSSPASKGFDRAFAVLVERNWEKSGAIDLRGGEGRNSPAVEIGLRFIQSVQAQRSKAKP